MAEKTTKAEVFQRVAQVYELMLRHVERSNIVQYGSKKWGVSPRQVDKYIYSARKMLYETVGDDLNNERNRIINELRYLYSEALRKEQLKTCLEIKKTEAKIMGLLSDKINFKGNITNENSKYSYMNDDQVKREIDQLISTTKL